MTTLVIVAGIVVVALAAAVVRRRSGRDSSQDLGTVSHHWLAEQRLGPGRDSHR